MGLLNVILINLVVAIFNALFEGIVLVTFKPISPVLNLKSYGACQSISS